MLREFTRLQIPVDKIRDVIGPGGKMIRSIIEQTGVKIDVEDTGKVNVASNDEASANKASADHPRSDGYGRGGEDLSRDCYSFGGLRCVCRNHSRNRWVAAHQRSRGASHQGCA